MGVFSRFGRSRARGAEAHGFTDRGQMKFSIFGPGGAAAYSSPAGVGAMRAHLLAAFLLLFALLLIYGRSGGFDYVDYDDMDYVVRTNAVRAGLTADGVRWAFTAFHKSNWHPLTWISHMMDVSLFGLAGRWRASGGRCAGSPRSPASCPSACRRRRTTCPAAGSRR